ncbi:MAG TPA: SCO family protein [Caldilineaceae bacterium]|nr:SCO family protein [Caldilineaceae bacterium]
MQSSKIWHSFILCMLMLTTSCTPRPQLNGTVFDTPVEAYNISGTNYDGAPFRLSDTQGKITMVFFGYTFCPDVCPFTLADLNTVSEELGDKASEMAVVFVTVDPERDTLEKMAQYVKAFNQTFYGVRVEGDAMEAAKATFGIYAAKSDVQTGNDDAYFVDHTAAIYLIDRDGNLRETFLYDAGPEQILPDVEYWLQEG